MLVHLVKSARSALTSVLLLSCGSIPAPNPNAPLLTSGFHPGTTGRAPTDAISVLVRSEGASFDSAAQLAVRNAIRLVRWPGSQPVEIMPVAEPVDSVNAALHLHTFVVSPRSALDVGWYAVVADRSALGRVQPVPYSTVERAGVVAFPFRVGSAPRVVRIDQCAPRSLGARVIVTMSEPVVLGSEAPSKISVRAGAEVLTCSLSGNGAQSNFVFDCASLLGQQDIVVRVGEGVCSPVGPCLTQSPTAGAAEFALTSATTLSIEEGCRSLLPPIETP